MNDAMITAMPFILAIIYFLPFLVAYRNSHPQTAAIGVLNFFLGWTFVGWVAALVWANVRDR